MIYKTVSLLSITLIFSFITPIMAHQPFFESEDITADMPWQIKDPNISTAIYASLESQDDVDYYSFNGSKNQSILLSITIPQIAGQENFTPAMALIGPGLPTFDLPKRIAKSQGGGVQILPSPKNATPFFEPFTRTSYWTRQEQNVTIPENASYAVAVWDGEGQLGRYVFVIGTKEIRGGDPDFAQKIGLYWTPFGQQRRSNYMGQPEQYDKDGNRSPVSLGYNQTAVSAVRNG